PPTQPDGSAMNGGAPSRGGFGGEGLGGGGRRGFGGRGGGRFGAQAGGRIQLAVYHTIHFVDRVSLQAGGLPIDLLNGGATGNGGGQPRHEVEAQAGYANNGLGIRFSENWQSATHVDAGTPLAPTALRFGALSKLNVRLFDDFSQNLPFIKNHKWAAGLRVSLNVSNVFDARQRVTDQTGIVPISYQGAYLDPVGRTVSLSIRKLFF
nr:TonB-dependent receptor [Pseudomonadota bacterium]